MNIRILLLFWLTLFAGLAHAAGSQAGFIVTKSDGTGYVYFLEPQPLTQPIFIQRPDAQGNPKCCLKLNPGDLKETDARTAADSQRIDVVSTIGGADPGFVAYKIVPRLPINGPFAGMAVMADKVTARSSYQLLSKTNGKPLSVRICFGTEGENLIVKEGRKREYSPLYLYFGYDIDAQPKCTARDRRALS